MWTFVLELPRSDVGLDILINGGFFLYYCSFSKRFHYYVHTNAPLDVWNRRSKSQADSRTVHSPI